MAVCKTIGKAVDIEGTGLHTGRRVTLRFEPASAGSGITFVRTDIKGEPRIRASVDNVLDVASWGRRTSIGVNGAEIHTIEHVMAALCGLSVTDLVIKIDGDEVPSTDGSALPFFEALRQAGVVGQKKEAPAVALRGAVWVENDNAMITLLPGEERRISYTLAYRHPLLMSQYVAFEFSEEAFEKEIAPARTFCLEEEVDTLRGQGLGRGADYDNTVVVGPRGVIKNTPRFEDEFARHKVLDLIGDLYLLGGPVYGRIVAVKSGHALNLELLGKISREQKKQMGAAVVSPCREPVGAVMDTEDIKKVLPHRPPFLFVDRIIEMEKDKRAVGTKILSPDEDFFKGHFPGHPIMPAVLTVEAMAQVAGVLMLHKAENRGKLAYFMSMDKVKLRRPVFPGDELRLEVEVVKLRSKVGQVKTRALVGTNVVAEAELMFSLVSA